jgi:hypothetical protein
MRSIPTLPLLATLISLGFYCGNLSAANASIVETLSEKTTSEKPVRLADARSYRHCHNINVRVYCHKRDQLPMNWPPLSDTPGQDRIEPRNPTGSPQPLKQKRA